ncbi:MAG: hypothetical protein ACYCQI_04385 [Gammaproteobacteria bacterium]
MPVIVHIASKSAVKKAAVERAIDSDPHREIVFGGVSREDHIRKACLQALGHPIPRMLQLKKMGHSASHQPIDLYNHGGWHIDEDKKKKTDFKVFSTGDAFSILSPDIDVQGMPVNIHVGIDHDQKHSPWTLLHEVFQLCRTVREQGAKSITVALPEENRVRYHILYTLKYIILDTWHLQIYCKKRTEMYDMHFIIKKQESIMFRYQTPDYKPVATREGVSAENLRRVEQAFLEREKVKKEFQEVFAEKRSPYYDPYPGYDDKVRKLAQKDIEASKKFASVCQREGSDIVFVEKKQSQPSYQKSKSSTFGLNSIFCCCSEDSQNDCFNPSTRAGYRS